MPLLKESTLEQIAAELRSRQHLTFALVVLREGPGKDPCMFASTDCDALDATRLLMAGAQDILEYLVNGLPGEDVAWNDDCETIPSVVSDF